jgi:Domain of unknown function (DUF4062)
MVDKRYQVFVSSTSIDLQDERKVVINALLQASFIPVGMEIFNAATENSWPVIRRLIDGCDYYVVIVAGRYGYQLTETGKSYTQSEYEYARDIGKQRLAFLHKHPEKIAIEYADHAGSSSARKLRAFRGMLERELLVNYWERSGDELARIVVTSLNSEVDRNPQTGWVRGDSLAVINSGEFPSRAKFWLYAAKRIRESHSIDDLTWGIVINTRRTKEDEDAYTTYREAIQEASTGKGANKDKTYREIMSFPNDIRLGRAASLLDSEQYPNFQLKCFDYDHIGTPPLLQFYIFDEKEILVSLVPLTGNPRDCRYMFFKNDRLSKLMCDYFDAAWRDAIVLKDYEDVRWDRLKDIAHRLGSNIFDDAP